MENSFNTSEHLYRDKIYYTEGNAEVLQEVRPQDLRILDIGCGAGDNARILKALHKHVTGVTVSQAEADVARTICDEVIMADIEKTELPLTGKFDCIILSHVCEHLVDPASAINRVSKFLNKGGRIIIAVPNVAFYKNRFRLLKGDWTRQDSGPFDRTHLHFYSFNSANDVFDARLLTREKSAGGYFAIPLWPLRLAAPKMCARLDIWIGRRFPNLFAQQVVLVLVLK